MRILLVGDYPRDPRLGSTKVFVKLQEEFRAIGHVCDLLLADDLGAFPRNRFARQLLEPIMALVAVVRASRRAGQYDVVDVASAEGLWLAIARRLGLFHSAVVSRSNGLEHLNYQRMLDDAAAGLWKKPFTRRWWYPLVRLSQVEAAAKYADRLILLNRLDRDFVLAHRWRTAATVDLIAHGVSTPFIASAPCDDRPRGGGILFCGTWDHMKGVHYLAAAFSRLVADGRTTNLTVLGGAVPEETIRAMFSAGAQQHLTIVGRVAEAEVIEMYRTHDVMVVSSSYEGFGMVLIEAMTQRLPVISTPVGAACAFVVDGHTGVLVPVRDSAALADALECLLDDPGRRRALAARAFEMARELTWTSTARATLAVYEQARANGRP
jgi:glycosyltransferase involved in cell wall biosynthesis